MQLFSRLSGFSTTSEESPEDRKWTLEERSVDEARPVRVIVIGSGISGILSSIRLRQRIPNLDLRVYEKNSDIGGTWLENRYPGCACGMLSILFVFLVEGLSDSNCMTDIPAHTYQATFEPNKEWSEFYASAPEIHQYWKHVADKFGCGKYIKLKQQVVQAAWSDDDSQWKLQVSIPS